MEFNFAIEWKISNAVQERTFRKTILNLSYKCAILNEKKGNRKRLPEIVTAIYMTAVSYCSS